MKKILLVLAVLVGVAFTSTAQQVNFPEGNLLIYSDTSNLAGGDVFVRALYSYIPQNMGDGTYTYLYKKLYYLNDDIIKNEFITYRTTVGETLLISGVNRTYQWVQNQVVTISTANWQTATWQTFLQKLN